MRGKFSIKEKRAIKQILGIQIADFQAMKLDHQRKLDRIISLSNKGLKEVTIEDVDKAINEYINKLTPVQIDPDLIFDLPIEDQDALQQIAVNYFIIDRSKDLNENMPFVHVIRKMLVAEEYKETLGNNLN